MNKMRWSGSWIAASSLMMLLNSSKLYGYSFAAVPARIGFRLRLGTSPLKLGSKGSLGFYASGQLQRLEKMSEFEVNPLDFQHIQTSLEGIVDTVTLTEFEDHFAEWPRSFLGGGVLLGQTEASSKNLHLFAFECGKKTLFGMDSFQNVFVANGFPQNFRISFQAHNNYASFRCRGYCTVPGQEGLSWKSLHQKNWSKLKSELLFCLKFLQIPTWLTPDLRIGGQAKYDFWEEGQKLNFSGLLEVHTLNHLISGRIQLITTQLLKFSLQFNLDGWIGTPIRLLPLLN